MYIVGSCDWMDECQLKIENSAFHIMGVTNVGVSEYAYH